MLLIARRTALAAALLLVMPLTVWLSGWLWQPGLPVAMLKSLWWVTETVTQPWGIITHVVLCGWFLWCLRFRLRAALILFLILAAAILAGQGGEILGQGAGPGAETVRHLAGKHKAGAGDAILRVKA
ncbi:phosphatidylglycerophosphatase B [Klebsiella pneumoniae]|uniref:Phosphatidylglycerophosphatase B n=1 Tax=Klebsiella pneumoniae TaxID=573 RepID=A0A377V470_KLEPN|nr:phosphatidylglycerophosphatase B [Klebsiella pneumoniae]